MIQQVALRLVSGISLIDTAALVLVATGYTERLAARFFGGKTATQFFNVLDRSYAHQTLFKNSQAKSAGHFPQGQVPGLV